MKPHSRLLAALLIHATLLIHAMLLIHATLPFVCLAAPSDTPDVRRTEDVIYGRKFGMALTMDVFQPARQNSCGIIFLVNGGWLSSKATPLMVTIQPDYYKPFLDRGYTVFAVVTSSQPAFTIPDIMADVQRAVRFVRHHATRFDVRPDRLGVTGSSSGGQLTLMIATQGGPGTPDATDPVDRESSAVQAATCFFPPTDFLNYGGPGIDAVGLGPMKPLEAAFVPRSQSESGRLSLGKEISPIYFVTSSLPPTLIIHGDADQVVPIQQAESFVERARSAGAKHIELITRQGKGHGWGEFWKSSDDIRAFVNWFDRFLVE
jgi:acetyl esterase/lipase